jgi:hypothetical protein
VPKLLRSSETAGCGPTIELDSKEVVYIDTLTAVTGAMQAAEPFLSATLQTDFGANSRVDTYYVEEPTEQVGNINSNAQWLFSLRLKPNRR